MIYLHIQKYTLPVIFLTKVLITFKNQKETVEILIQNCILKKY